MVNGTDIPVYAFDPNSDSSRVDFAWVNLPANSDIKILLDQSINDYKIAPVSYGLKGEVNQNQLEFNTDKFNYFHVTINDLHKLILIADTKEYKSPDTNKQDV